MNLTHIIPAAGALVLALGTTAALTAGPGADAAQGTKTLTFTSVEKSETNPGKYSFVDHDILKKGGKTIGFDLADGIYDPKTGTVDLDVALGLDGGVILVHLANYGDDGGTGRITGGTGRYRGIKGSVVAKNLTKSGSKTKVTLTYK